MYAYLFYDLKYVFIPMLSIAKALFRPNTELFFAFLKKNLMFFYPEKCPYSIKKTF